MAKVIMVQGTMSNVGKSLICAGLCRIFAQDGYRAAPFKSQNMALNSYITEEGLEMGRAQVMQAEAAGIAPTVCMNPILLKPTTDMGSQVIVNGEVLGNMPAKEYFSYKKKLVPKIIEAFQRLETMADIIVIEGAGSPAEINLKENDIVNMGMAELADAPVLLAGDIDRGGVFAQLLGTLMLLTDAERSRVKGLIINKFRGDKTILDPGIRMLEEKGKVPVTGVVPYMSLLLEDEDSLSVRFEKRERGKIDLAVIRFPRISNFTDFNVFEQHGNVSVRYVTSARELGEPDLIFLPGSKNTMGDLKWMRENGLEAAVRGKAGDTAIFGICGGYQMLGRSIRDPYEAEEGGSMSGMCLLPVETTLRREKTRRQRKAVLNKTEGILAGLSGKDVMGYEIHMGDTVCVDRDFFQGCSEDGSTLFQSPADGKIIVSKGNVYGTYVHGIFDGEGIAGTLLKALAKQKGIPLDTEGMLSYARLKETQYDRLADTLRQYMDMEAVYKMLRPSRI